MKSYLSLIPISAKVRRRQNRMTILCIIISVLLVTAIFSVADMMIRTETTHIIEKHGKWHIQLENIAQETAEEISQRSDVAASGWKAEFNTDADKSYFIGKKKATLYGTDEIYIIQLADGVEEGSFPQNNNEVMLSSNAKQGLHLQLGDRVRINTPAKEAEYIVSGFGSDDKEYYRGQTYLVAVYMTQDAFAALMEQNGVSYLGESSEDTIKDADSGYKQSYKQSYSQSYYVQFQDSAKAAEAIPALQQQYQLPQNCISENKAVMGLTGKSSNQSIINMYGIAAVLFVLVLTAGVLMISGSMNSNVAQRMKFFGMMRCIGASRRQIICFVRLEALNWCKTAVPIGLFAGTAASWGICVVLHYGIGGEFAAMPVFALSPVGLISGAAVGIVTVLFAAQSPAKRAARVSPMMAVSGNAGMGNSVKHTIKFHMARVEWILGIHHAVASKKNLLLMTGSFALSIIMFLCFFVGMDFIRKLMPSMQPYQPDVTIGGYKNALIISQDFTEEIRKISGVSHIWGSSYLYHFPASSPQQDIEYINLVSYSDYLLDCAKDSVMQGNLSAIYGNSSQVITVKNKENPLKVGDIIEIGEKKVEITCAISEGLYPSENSIICSQETFAWLTGEQNYNLIGVQFGKNVSEETVQQIADLAVGEMIFTDERVTNQENNTTYWATRILGYSVLAIIASITLFNIMNSISMSVTARIKQYGAMRAVGMDGRQLTYMITAEAFTYAITGLVVGCGVGIPLSRFLHIRLLTYYFGIEWYLPSTLVMIVIIFVLASAVIAVYSPAKRIRNMAITATINEL